MDNMLEILPFLGLIVLYVKKKGKEWTAVN